MVDLVIRPSGRNDPKQAWAVQLRWHESLGETEYQTLCRVPDEVAREIVRAGAPSWLFGDPDNGGAVPDCLKANGPKQAAASGDDFGEG
jgi:hypothetical protein